MPARTVDGLLIFDVPWLDLGLYWIYRICLHDARIQGIFYC